MVTLSGAPVGRAIRPHAVRGPSEAAIRQAHVGLRPALDGINTLIMLAHTHTTLIHRPIAIHVFDARQDGPTFGARALRALTAHGGALHGLEIQFQHHPYDWSDTAPLARLLDGLAARGAIIATSSEGGLFEYGSDDVVVANLTALALVGVPIVALGHELERRAQADDRADEIPVFCAGPGRLRAARRAERLCDR